jgi:hypothetical protein
VGRYCLHRPCEDGELGEARRTMGASGSGSTCVRLCLENKNGILPAVKTAALTLLAIQSFGIFYSDYLYLTIVEPSSLVM